MYYYVFRIHHYFWPSNAWFFTIILVHPCGACELRPRPRPRQKKGHGGISESYGKNSCSPGCGGDVMVCIIYIIYYIWHTIIYYTIYVSICNMNLVWAMTKRIDISCPCSHTLPSFLVGFWHLKTGEVFGWSMPSSIPILGTQIWPTSRSFWRSFCGFTLYLGRKKKRWIRGDSLWWSSSETFARNMWKSFNWDGKILEIPKFNW